MTKFIYLGIGVLLVIIASIFIIPRVASDPPPEWYRVSEIISSGYVQDQYDCSNMSATLWAWYTVNHPHIEAKVIEAKSPLKSKGHSWVRVREGDDEWHIDPARRTWNKKGWEKQWPHTRIIPDEIVLAYFEYMSPYYRRRPDYTIENIKPLPK